MTLAEARSLVEACEAAGVRLQVNQNMRYDHSVRALKGLLDRGDLGEPVLATIEMRAIPHWMPWAEGGRSLSTFIMSIHHLDTFRYWLGDPARVLASTRPDPRTKFPHDDGINLYILEYDDGARASAWDDVWAGPAREGAGADIAIRWRVEGTEGLALGTIGWPGWPEPDPEHDRLLDRPRRRAAGTAPDGPKPGSPTPSPARWPGSSAPSRTATEPDISGRDHLKTLALCEAVLAAGREHRVVEFAEFAAIDERRGEPTRPRRMYHYTDRAGYNSIRAMIEWRFRAGQPIPRGHPFGAYFTPLGPETPKAKLRMLFVPERKREFVFAFEDLGDLIPLRGGRGLYVVYSPEDYVVERSRQLDHGASGDVVARRRVEEEDRP